MNNFQPNDIPVGPLELSIRGRREDLQELDSTRALLLELPVTGRAFTGVSIVYNPVWDAEIATGSNFHIAQMPRGARPPSVVSSYPHLAWILASMTHVEEILLQGIDCVPTVMPQCAAFIRALGVSSRLTTLSLTDCHIAYQDLVAVLQSVAGSLTDLTLARMYVPELEGMARKEMRVTPAHPFGLLVACQEGAFAPPSDGRAAYLRLQVLELFLSTPTDYLLCDMFSAHRTISPLQKVDKLKLDAMIPLKCTNSARRLGKLLQQTRLGIQQLEIGGSELPVHDGEEDGAEQQQQGASADVFNSTSISRRMDFGSVSTLELNVLVEHMVLTDPGMLEWLSWCLSALEGRTHRMRKVVITVTFYFGAGNTHIPGSVHEAQLMDVNDDAAVWARFDQALSRAHLSSVSVKMVRSAGDLRLPFAFEEEEQGVSTNGKFSRKQRHVLEGWLGSLCLPRTGGRHRGLFSRHS